MADQPRHPLYVRYWPPYYGASRDTPYNLTIEMSAASPLLVPFAQLIWPLPLRLPYRQYAQSYSTPVLVFPGVAANQPFNLENWSLPPALPYRQYAQSYSSPYALIAVAVEVTYKPPSYDYPLPPALPRRLPPSYATPFPLTYVVMPPQWDFFKPRRLPHTVYAQSYSSPKALTAPVVAPPFNQDDWPLPRPPYRVYADVRSSYPPLLNSIKPPITQRDWPSPKPPYIVRSVSYSTPAMMIPPTEVIITGLVQDTHYPLPPILPYRQYTLTYAAPTSLLTARPTVQVDWPVPGRSPTPALTWRNGLTALQLQQPFNQSDWPVPRRAPVSATPPWVQSALALLSVQPPFVQTNWPLPRLAFQPTSARTWIQSAIMVVTPLPIAQRDWPLPKQPPRVYADVRRADIQLLHSVKPPNRLNYWPLPPQRAVPQLTSGFVRGMLRVPVFAPRSQGYIVGD